MIKNLEFSQKKTICSHIWRSHKFQLVFIAIFPSFIVAAITFASFKITQQQCEKLISDYSDKLYQDQISNSKLQNTASVVAMNQEMQSISWKVNMLINFWKKIYTGEAVQNSGYIPSLLNAERTYFRTGDPVFLKLFQKSPILISSWEHPDTIDLSELDDTTMFQLNKSVAIDSLMRSIKHQNLEAQSQINNTQLAIKDIFFGFEHSGLIYVTGYNTTYSKFIPAEGCQVPKYKFDVRCRYYYLPTLEDISIEVFSPSFLYSLIGIPFLSTIFCSRIMIGNEKVGILCLSLNLEGLPTFMKSFKGGSYYQMIIDPFQNMMIYDSKREIGPQVINIWDWELKYLQDQSQSYKFQEFLTTFGSQEIISYSKKIDSSVLLTQKSINQETFEYNRNGTECFVIANRVTMTNIIPLESDRKLFNAKYLEKNVFIFLDVLTRESLTLYTQNLNNQINQAYTITYSILITTLTVAIVFQFVFAVKLSYDLQKPIVHLTEILKSIHLKSNLNPTQSKWKENLNHFKKSYSNINTFSKIDRKTNASQPIFTTEEQDVTQKDIFSFLAEQQWEKIAQDICLSSDTQSLFNNFRNLFKILQFTSQRIFKENICVSLLNYSRQIEHFKEFGNYRALGVCHNNIANLHYTSGRYKEALENYQSAIVYSQYELDLYSNQIQENILDQQQIFLSQNHPSIDLQRKQKNSLFSNKGKTNHHNENKYDILKLNAQHQENPLVSENPHFLPLYNKVNNTLEYGGIQSNFDQIRKFTSKKDTPIENNNVISNQLKMYLSLSEDPQADKETIPKEKLELWWNVFNRKFNFAKTLYCFMTSQENENVQMWEETEKVFRELFRISNSGVLPLSHKRQMDLLYFFALSLFKQDKSEEFSEALIAYEETFKAYHVFKATKQKSEVPSVSYKLIQSINSIHDDDFPENDDYQLPSFQNPLLISKLESHQQIENEKFKIRDKLYSFAHQESKDDTSKLLKAGSSMYKSDNHPQFDIVYHPKPIFEKKVSNVVQQSFDNSIKTQIQIKKQKSVSSLISDNITPQNNQSPCQVINLNFDAHEQSNFYSDSPSNYKKITKNNNLTRQRKKIQTVSHNNNSNNNFFTSKIIRRFSQRCPNSTNFQDTNTNSQILNNITSICRNDESNYLSIEQKKQIEFLPSSEQDVSIVLPPRDKRIFQLEYVNFIKENFAKEKKPNTNEKSQQDLQISKKPSFNFVQQRKKSTQLLIEQHVKQTDSKNNKVNVNNQNDKPSFNLDTFVNINEKNDNYDSLSDLLFEEGLDFFKVKIQQAKKAKASYEFSSDIFAQKYSLLASQKLLSTQQYKSSAIILTEQIEQSYLYLPILKSYILQNLSQIFKQENINNPELNQLISMYDQGEQIIFKICLISSVTQVSSKEMCMLLCRDILKEVLLNDNDQFGIVTHNISDDIFEEKLFLHNKKLLYQKHSHFCELLVNIFLTNQQDSLLNQSKDSILQHHQLDPSPCNNNSPNHQQANNTFDPSPQQNIAKDIGKEGVFSSLTQKELVKTPKEKILLPKLFPFNDKDSLKQRENSQSMENQMIDIKVVKPPPILLNRQKEQDINQGDKDDLSNQITRKKKKNKTARFDLREDAIKNEADQNLVSNITEGEGQSQLLNVQGKNKVDPYEMNDFLSSIDNTQEKKRKFNSSQLNTHDSLQELGSENNEIKTPKMSFLFKKLIGEFKNIFKKTSPKFQKININDGDSISMSSEPINFHSQPNLDKLKSKASLFEDITQGKNIQRSNSFHSRRNHSDSLQGNGQDKTINWLEDSNEFESNSSLSQTERSINLKKLNSITEKCQNKCSTIYDILHSEEFTFHRGAHFALKKYILSNNKQITLYQGNKNASKKYKRTKGTIKKSNDYAPSMLNIERTFTNDEDPEILSLYHKNPNWISSWHQVNSSYVSELDNQSRIELNNSNLLDPLFRILQYENGYDRQNHLQIENIFLTHEYDGLLYSTHLNSTFKNYIPPQDCLYSGKFKLDIRCKNYYQETMDSSGIQIFAPSIYLSSISQLGSTICQRYLQKVNEVNLKGEDIESYLKYSAICMSINLNNFTYYKNSTNSLLFSAIVDPRSLGIVYLSTQENKLKEEITLKQAEADYLQDQDSAKIFLDELNQKSTFIMESAGQLNEIYFESSFKYQKAFEYDRNGTLCFAILNVITILDMPLKIEIDLHLSKSYQLKSMFLTLNVYSKDEMTKYTTNIQEDVIKYSKYFFHGGWFTTLIILLADAYCAYLLGSRILLPIYHLTSILKSIKFTNELQNKGSNHHLTSEHSRKNSFKEKKLSNYSFANKERKRFSQQYQPEKNSFFDIQKKNISIKELPKLQSHFSSKEEVPFTLSSQEQALSRNKSNSSNNKNFFVSKNQFINNPNNESQSSGSLDSDDSFYNYGQDTHQVDPEFFQSGVEINSNYKDSLDGNFLSKDMEELYESFCSMFKILTFTTSNIFQEKESISLLNLNVQVQHFEEFGNHRALGVCHNNIGYIHFNCGRYKEAVQHFEQSVLQAKYELNFYSHQATNYQQSDIQNHAKQNLQRDKNPLNSNEFQVKCYDNNDNNNDNNNNQGILGIPIRSQFLIDLGNQVNSQANIQSQKKSTKSNTNNNKTNKQKGEEKKKKTIQSIRVEEENNDIECQTRSRVKSSIMKRLEKSQINDNNFIQSFKTQIQGEQEELYWSLYNRRVNYCKALLALLKSNSEDRISLWDVLGEVAIENAIISQLYLPSSNKREMLNYYFIAFAYDQQNRPYEASQTLNRFSSLYISTIQTKIEDEAQSNKHVNNIVFSSAQQKSYQDLAQNNQAMKSQTELPELELNAQSSIKNPQTADTLHGSSEQNYRKIKSKSVKKLSFYNQEKKLNESTLKQSSPTSPKKRNYQKHLTLLATANNCLQNELSNQPISLALKIPLGRNLSNGSDSPQKVEEGEKLIVSPSKKNPNFFGKINRISIQSTMKTETGTPQSPSQQDKTIQNQFLEMHQDQESQKQLNPSLSDFFSPTHFQISNNKRNQQGSMLVHSDQNIKEDDHLNILEKQNSDQLFKNHQTIMGEREKILQKSFKTFHSMTNSNGGDNLKIIEQKIPVVENKFTKKYLPRVSALFKLDRTKEHQANAKKIFDIPRKSRDKKDKIFRKTLLLKPIKRFYCVRKMEKNNSISYYEFSSDIMFMHYVILQAQCQMQRGSCKEAANLLTASFEQCEFYLPHLKLLAVQFLNQIFKEQNLKSDHLEELVQNTKISPNREFKIIVISAGKLEQTYQKSYAICNDILNEILFKEQDHFGLITFENRVQLFSTIISLTSKQTINTSFNLFDAILKNYLLAPLEFNKQLQEDFKVENSKNSSSSSSSSQESQSESSIASKNINSFIIEEPSQISIIQSESPSARRVSNRRLMQEKNRKLVLEINKMNQKPLINSDIKDQDLTFSKNNENIVNNIINENKKDFISSKQNVNNQFFLNPNCLPTTNNQKKIEVLPDSVVSDNIQVIEISNDEISCQNITSEFPNTSIQFTSQNKFESSQKQEKNEEYTSQQMTPSQNMEEHNFKKSKLMSKFMQTDQPKSTLRDSQQIFNFSLNDQNQEGKINFNNPGCQFLNIDQLVTLKESHTKINFSMTPRVHQTYQNNSQKNDVNKKRKSENLSFSFAHQALNFQGHLSISKPQIQVSNFDSLNSKKKNSQQIQYTKLASRSSEETFHFGIHAALKNYILDSHQKQAFYYAKINHNKKRKSSDNSCQNISKTFVVYITDDPIHFKNKQLFEKLYGLLSNLRVELLVLILSTDLQTEEFPVIEDIQIANQTVIKFFTGEERMLQYIYNQREHIQNKLQPMIIEHF